MKTIKTLLIAFIVIHICGISVPSCKDTGTNSDCKTDTSKILFLGSSYFNNNNLPNLIKNLADCSDKETLIDQYIPGGLYLSDHASSSVTEEKINEQHWDYVVLQGVGRITAYPDYFTDHPVYPALETLQNKIFENCETTKMVFCLPWAYEDGMTWYGWSDTYADMQEKIYNNTLQYSNDLDFPIAPVGWAWYAVLEEENYPQHYLHMSDWNHPSLRGSYLMACVIFSTIFQESSVGIAYYAGLPQEEANNFQTVASNIVLDNLDLWNIAINTDAGDSPTPVGFYLFQNYPNPFNPSTTINYNLAEDSDIMLKIYNSLGQEVKTLVNDFQTAGYNSAEWDGTDNFGELLSSGVYIYRIQTDKGFINSQSNKMILLK